jgi:hypothetical protein
VVRNAGQYDPGWADAYIEEAKKLTGQETDAELRAAAERVIRNSGCYTEREIKQNPASVEETARNLRRNADDPFWIGRDRKR